MLLAIESSTDRCSVALADQHRVTSRDLLLPRRHNEELLGAIAELLSAWAIAPKDLSACAFGAGPGSFTGIRLAAAAAYAFGWAHAVPVFAIDAASCTALAAWTDPATAAATAMVDAVWLSDARVEQMYWARVGRDDRGLPHVRGMQLARWSGLAEAPWGDQHFIAVGDGWQDPRLPPHLLAGAHHYNRTARPTAAGVATLAQRRFAAGERPALGSEQPIYLRGADAWDVRKGVANSPTGG